MTSMVTTPIGTSMVDFIQRASLSSESSFESRPQSECAIERPQSALLQAIGHSSHTIVKGSRRSGRSSLAMDMAHSIACIDTPCRGDCDRVRTSCRCVSVVLLVPAYRHAPSFPLHCQFTSAEPQDLPSKLTALEQSTTTRPIIWSKAALRRIQVHHLASMRDLMEYLLSIQGKPASQQPHRAILLDDVDFFARMDTTIPERQDDELLPPLSTQQFMSVTQILALFADTANLLRQSTSPSLTVLATMETGFPTNVERIFAKWYPVRATLHPAVGGCWKPSIDEGENIESTWSVDLECAASTEDESSIGQIQYSFIRSLDGSCRILWTHA